MRHTFYVDYLSQKSYRLCFSAIYSLLLLSVSSLLHTCIYRNKGVLFIDSTVSESCFDYDGSVFSCSACKHAEGEVFLVGQRGWLVV